MSKLMVTSIIIILSKLQFDVSSSNKTSQFVTSVPTYGRLHCKQCANMLKWFSVKWKGYSQHGVNMSFSTKQSINIQLKYGICFIVCLLMLFVWSFMFLSKKNTVIETSPLPLKGFIFLPMLGRDGH